MDTKNPMGPAQKEEAKALESVKMNKKMLVTISAAVLVIAIVALAWYFIAMRGAAKADEAVALADTEMNDSIALQYYMDASELGYKSGNRAGLNAAIMLYQKGEYEQALQYLKKSSVSSSIIEAGKYSLMGDCYANLNQLDEAVSAFKDAIKAAKGNDQITPFVLVKLANVYRAQGKFDDEYKAYKQIIDDYPVYVQNLKQRADIRKYAERAKASAENK